MSVVPAWAEEGDGQPRVARVSFIEGDVSYLNADADEWTAVDVNAPLVTGDRFYSGADGRAEIQLPGGVYARVSEETELDLLEVSEQAVHVRVAMGTATFRLRSVPAGQHVEISTPATALVARTRGVYRVDVAEDGQTTVLVREGEADAYLGDERYRLAKDRGARFAMYEEGAAEEPIDVFDASAVELDPWDEWERERAGRIQSAVSYQYVDDDVYGAEDLDQYGDWDRHQEYGPIWRPRRVASDWAPYTNGRWVWQDPWGWTWVDYEPWGWAPSHYGRWVYVQDYWAWAPGPVVARPVYAPATVGFLGVSVNTPGLSVSVGIGPSVGWVPLGWGEPIIPWWRGGGVEPGRPWWGGWGGPRVVNNTVIKNTNITNINVNNIRYVNIDRGRGFTAVDRDSFVRGDFRRLDLPRDRLRDITRPLRGAPDVIPQRESLFAARPAKLREGGRARPQREALQRAAVTTRAVPGARPAFDQKRKLIEQAKGQPVPANELRRLARSNQRGNDPERAVRTVTARGGRAVTPEITAQAPKQARGPIERQARGARPDERRDSLAVERGTAEPGRGGRDERAARPGAADERTQRNERNARTLPGQPQERGAAARQRGAQDEAREQRAGEQGRERPDAVARERRQPVDAPERADAQRSREQRPGDADARAAARTAPERNDARGERQREPAGRESSAPTERQRVQPQREQAERTQREQAERTQRDAAARQQRDTEQRERVQRERQQSERTQQAERESKARQQRDTEQRERVQRERQQSERVQRERQQSERTQQAERQQREQVQRRQRDQAEQQQQQQQREQMQRQRDAGARQQRDAEQRQRAQVERQQAQRAQAERQQAQRAQTERQQAQRAQAERQQAQRAQTERQQAQRSQREAAARQQRAGQQQRREQVDRQQAPQNERAQRAPSDPREAARKRQERKKRQEPAG